MRRILTACLLALLIVMGLTPRLSAATPALTWQSLQTSQIASEDLNGVAYGNGLYVAVGEAGAILTSSDGENWVRRQSPTSWPLNGVAFGAGRFVAVGGVFDFGRQLVARVMLTSVDGETWSVVRAGQGLYPWVAVVYANGRFLAVGGAQVSTSEDGLTWTAPQSAPPIKAVTYGNGKYVAIGNDALFVSEDGLKWNKSREVYQGRGVAYGGGKFIATADTRDLRREILSSADGLSWSSSVPGVSGVEQLTYGAGRFVGVGFRHDMGLGSIATSSDGVNWTQVASGTGSWLKGVAYGAGRFIVVGSAGTILTLDETGQWEERPLRAVGSLASIAYGSGRFVAVGSGGTVVMSEDGLSWTQQNSNVEVSLQHVRYGNGRFVAIAREGTILTSEDGTKWQPAPRPEGVTLSGLAFGKGLFVAVGHPGVIMTSADGVHWTSRESGATFALGDVTFGNGRFYAFEFGGSLFTSTDGVTWTKSASSDDSSIHRLMYFGGRLIAKGNSMLASEDAANRDLKRAPWMWDAFDFAQGNGWQVTVGNKAFASRDGVTWTEAGGEVGCLRAVTYGEGRFVGVGLYGCFRTAQAEPAGSLPALPLPEGVKIHRPTIAPPPGFRDLAPQHWAFQAVGAAVNAQLIYGYPEGFFLPDAPIRRAEFLAVLMRAYPQPDVIGEPFADVPEHHWAYDLILQARGAGLVVGEGNWFRPNDYISRAEMAVILQRALQLPVPAQLPSFPDVDAAWSWAADSVQVLSAYGLIRGFPDGSFGPGRTATRAETAAILTRLFQQ